MCPFFAQWGSQKKSMFFFIIFSLAQQRLLHCWLPVFFLVRMLAFHSLFQVKVHQHGAVLAKGATALIECNTKRRRSAAVNHRGYKTWYTSVMFKNPAAHLNRSWTPPQPFSLLLEKEKKTQHEPVNQDNAQTYTRWQMKTILHVWYGAQGCVYLLCEKLTNWTNWSLGNNQSSLFCINEQFCIFQVWLLYSRDSTSTCHVCGSLLHIKIFDLGRWET